MPGYPKSLQAGPGTSGQRREERAIKEGIQQSVLVVVRQQMQHVCWVGAINESWFPRGTHKPGLSKQAGAEANGCYARRVSRAGLLCIGA